MKKAINNTRNLNLDFVRGVACLLVLLYHYTFRFFEVINQDNPWPVQVSFGYMGVSVLLFCR